LGGPAVRALILCAFAVAAASGASIGSPGSRDTVRVGARGSVPARPEVASPVGPPAVAVLPFTGEDIDPDKLAEATRHFQSQLASTDSFRLIPERQVEALVRDSLSRDSAACDNNDCSLRIGKMLGVQSVFTGIVSQEVETWRLEVSRTDVQSGKTTFDHLIEMYGSFDDLAGRGCYRMARMASGRESTEDNYTVLDGGGGGHVWPWVTGGIVLAAGGAAAAVLLLTHDGSNSTSPATTPDRLIVKW